MWLGVQLYNGNLVLDCQVPPKLLERVPRKDDREFTHMRYTAVTCDVSNFSSLVSEEESLILISGLVSCSQPDEFLNERYSLRQILYETPRRTELFIVLTMYNVRFLTSSIDPLSPNAEDWWKRLSDVQEDEVLFCRTMHGVMSEFPKGFQSIMPLFPSLALTVLDESVGECGLGTDRASLVAHRKHPTSLRTKPI